jgi:hypothetical protein
LTEAATKSGPCQVRSETEIPCPRSAEVEILGVAFCGLCAREQEVYFAIGELTHEEARDLHSKTLAEVLERKRRERELTGGIITPKRNRSAINEPVEETESSRAGRLDVSTFSAAE